MGTRRTQRWGLGLIVAATFTMTNSSLSYADPTDEPRERASRSFGEAKTAFALKNFTAAATAFEEAARLVPHPATWLNAAEAWELAGEPARAAEACDRVIAMANRDAHGVDATRRLERLLPKVATLEVQGSSPLSVRIDGGEQAAVPVRRRVSPGSHTLLITDLVNGSERQMALNLPAGSSKAIYLTEASSVQRPAPSPASPPAIPAPPAVGEASTRHAFDASPPLASWLAFGAAGAFTGVTIAFGVATLDAKNEYERAPSRDALDDFKQNRSFTNAALAASILSAAGGIAIWIASPRQVGAPRIEVTATGLRTSLSF